MTTQPLAIAPRHVPAPQGVRLDVAENVEQADAWWRSCAEEALDVLIASGAEFTSDDLELTFGIPHPEKGEANHVGSLIASYRARGRIVEVGRRRSTRPSANGRKIAVWQAAPPA